MPNPATPSPSDTTEATITFLRDLAKAHFWGNLILKMQGGSVIHITQETSIPADKLPNRTIRNAYDNSKA
jgi:hypothetical protein